MKCNLLQLVKLWPTGFAMLVLCALFSSPAYSMTVKEMRDKMPASRLAQAKAEFTRIEQRLGSVLEAQQQLGDLRKQIVIAELSYGQARDVFSTVKSRSGSNDNDSVSEQEAELATQADSDTKAVEAALVELRKFKPASAAVPAGPVQPPGNGSSSLTIKAMEANLQQLSVDINPESATETVNQFERQWGRLPEAKSQIEKTRALIDQATTAYNDAAKAYNASYNAAPDETKPISKGDEELVNKASAAAVALKTSLGRLKDFKPAVQSKTSDQNATNPHRWSALDEYEMRMIISIVLLLLLVALSLFFSRFKIIFNKSRHPDGSVSVHAPLPFPGSEAILAAISAGETPALPGGGERLRGSKGGDESAHSKLNGKQGPNDDQGRSSKPSLLSRKFGGEESMQMRQEPQLIHNNELTKNEDIEALDTTLLKLNTENTILKQNNNTFKQEIEMLNKGFETFNVDKKNFKEVIKTLKKEIETLKEDNKAFNEKWNNFEESLKRLKQKNIQENATPQTEPVWTEQTKPPKLEKPPEAEPSTLRDNSDNAKIGLPQEPMPIPAPPPETASPDPYKPAKREAIATAILHILNDPEFNQATAEDLNAVISEKLAAIFDVCPGVCRFYDFSFGKQVSGAMWHYLLLLYPASPQPTHGLLFLALEVNYSARHSKYFDGGLEHQTVSKLTQPANVAWNEDVPPQILQKGILKTSARA